MRSVYPSSSPLRPAVAAARSHWATLLDFLLPPSCVACGAAGSLICAACRELMSPADGAPDGGMDGRRCRHCWLPSDAPVCRDCLSRPLPLRELRSGFVYNGPVRAAVLALKQRGVSDVSRLLVVLAGNVQPASDIDLIVPIPIPLLRRRRRGGNQAEGIACAVAEQTGLSLDARALRRRGWWGPRQAQAATREDRRQLVSGAFAADAVRVRGRGVLLVDDVATTMATLSEAARTLRAAGAVAVDAWTAARAE